MTDWLLLSFVDLAMVVLSTVVVFVLVIVLTRLAGLRSFSKMSGFDFAMTIAVGSIIAATLTTKDPALLQGAAALAAVYGLQKVVNILRQHDWFRHLVDNTPLLLMKDGEVLMDNLKRSRVTLEDLRSKLREANVLERSQVRAVVFEVTGDISVLHSSDEEVELEDWLLQDVGGAANVEADPLAGR